MSAKLKSLRAGMLAGIEAEKTKSGSVDRFALAEKVIFSHPKGLLGQPANLTFSAESQASMDTGRQVIRVPLERLQENPLNARRIYDPKIVQERAASIVTHGQQTPGLAASDPNKPGWYVLIDGHYRKRALAMAGKTDMECFVEEGLSDLDFYRLSFMLNEQRSGQSALDNAIAWRQLLDEGKVKKEEDICEITGVSAGTVNKTLALLKLPERVLDVMKERPIGIGIATGYELTLYFKIMGEERTRELVHRVLEEGLSSRDVEQIRKVAQEGRTRKIKEVSRQYKIINDHGDLLGVIKEWDSGRVMLDVRLGDQAARASLVEALKNRFGLDAELL